MQTTTMIKDETYNGWTNYETWSVKLWMDNEQGSQDYYQEMSKEIYQSAKDGAPFDKLKHAKIELSNFIEEEYENAMQDILESQKLECTVWADLLGASLEKVNWYEIAESLLDGIEE